MKRMLKGLVFSSLILFGMSSFADKDCCDCWNNECSCADDSCDACDECMTICSYGGPCAFLPRPQGWAADRELVGWQQLINKFEMEDFHVASYIAPGFSRSLKPSRIAAFLFGPDYTGGKLTISGSKKGVTAEFSEIGAVQRGDKDWLADYFGLSPNFESTVKFCPQISNFFIDLGMYFGLDNILEGSFLKIFAPIVHTRWKLGMEEDVVTEGTLNFDAGYMDEALIPVANLPKTFEEAIKGVTWGDMQDKLKYSTINNSCCTRKETRLADLEVALGWNFLQDEDYHMGLMIRAAFPTGNKKCCKYIFEPIVGNGGYFELGAGLTASSRLWISDDSERSLWMYLDANAMHLFKRKVNRIFELTSKPNSRYMLVQEMKSPAVGLYGDDGAGGGILPSHQYNEKLMPLANLTACCVDSSIAVMGEVALKFTYNTGSWSFDLGYNLWGRTGEKVCKGCTIPENKYALKGDAYVIGFNFSGDEAVGLSATESEANIHSGTNTKNKAFELEDRENLRIDNAVEAYEDAFQNNNITISVPSNTQTNTSSTPVFLSSDMLKAGKTPSALSHKIFAHIGYEWLDEETNWTPFVGIGGSAEFSGRTNGIYSAVSQWAVWAKGGFAFN